jgi:hypothetical protein
MKARCKHLCGTSLNCALSAIEIYNKPDFKHREQVFSVLMVNAWELLFKAKILSDSRNRLNAIHVKEGKRYKRNRTGHHLTLGIFEAMARCAVPPLVAENIERVVEIRDAAMHLTADSHNLPYVVFTLGAASLRNYSKLIRQWFNLSLSRYNFYILPLGFEFPFTTLSAVDLKKEPEEVALVMSAVAKSQEKGPTNHDGFYLVCELHATLVSAKKITDDTDLVAKIDNQAVSGTLITRQVNLIDSYPFTYAEVFQKLRELNPDLKQQIFNDFLRDRKIKENPKYARYNYRSKLQESNGPRRGTPVVYNQDFIQFAKTELCQN